MPLRLPPINQAAAAVRDGYLPFVGGLDQETSPWEVKPGKLRDSENYEAAIEGGYEDIMGYERYDGRDRPSDATYSLLEVTITGSFEAGDSITGATSGATAEVVAVDTTTTTNDYLVITKISGTFQAAEDIEVSASVEGTSITAALADAASTTLLHAQYTNLAADEYRGDIGVVPGEGAVLGIWMLNDDKYAFRNKTGGATAGMYKQSTSGWTEVALGRELSFTSGGTHEILEGDTITGVTSGATAVITRVVLESGSWAGGNAAGRLIFASQTGTFQAENLDEGANSNVATIAADSSAITLQPSGSYEFYNSDFANSGGLQRMYGVDGVNRGFEFDGTVFVPIATGMTTDTPDHVVVHRQHLFFAFGASIQISGIGTPYIFTILSGAAEIVTDGSITGFQREPGSQGNAALLVANRHRLHMLYGTDSASWELVPFRDEVGAYEGTIQQVGYTLFLDDRGLTSYRTSQAFGNFKHSTLSTQIQTFINARRGLAVASCIVRNKNQYRLFFSDGSGLYVTMKGDKVAAMMPVQFEDDVRCIVSQENSSGSEEIYFGSDDGYVYQLEKGTSFDGDAISAYLNFHYTNDGVRYMKSWLQNATIEARGSGYAEIDFTYLLDYAAEDTNQPNEISKEIEFSTTNRWDQAGLVWDSGFWDGRTLAPTSGFRIDGHSENIGFVIRKNSDYFSPVRMTGIHYRYSVRRQMR